MQWHLRALSVITAGGGAWLLSFSAALAIELNPIEPFAHSVFRIEASDVRGQTMLGSGVLVAPHTVVTNCHVVGKAHEIAVTGADGRRPARLARAHAQRDLCLLEVPGLEGAVVTFSGTANKGIGEAITAVGFSGGAGLSASRGRIEGLYRYDGAGRVVQGSAAFTAGKSGGALFDSEGKLVGILTFKARAGGPFHFAVPAEWVVSLMRDAVGAVVTAGAKPFWQLPRERQPVFLRAASAAADGDCAAVNAIAAQWLAREPGNSEAILLVERARGCTPSETPSSPLLQKWLAAFVTERE